MFELDAYNARADEADKQIELLLKVDYEADKLI